jgi:hypothetical protein
MSTRLALAQPDRSDGVMLFYYAYRLRCSRIATLPVQMEWKALHNQPSCLIASSRHPAMRGGVAT